MAFVDLTGRRFGMLVALEKVNPKPNGTTTYWLCKCDCGNMVTKHRNVLVGNKGGKSCGCAVKGCRARNYSNTQIGDLTVLYMDMSYTDHAPLWVCQCSCGAICTKPSTSLSGKGSKHCGDRHKHYRAKDLSKKRFGLLQVRELIPPKKGEKLTWLCDCECGGIISVEGVRLVSGNVKSCGCIDTSIGEDIIQRRLTSRKVVFFREKTFFKCRYKQPLRYDFFLPDYGLCIEFDGEQHFRETPWHSKSPLWRVQERDNAKTKYCESSGLTLLRIRYSDIDRIDEILDEWNITYVA